MPSTNGCAHVNTRIERDGNDSVIVCTACGAEQSRVKDAFGDD